MPDRSQGSSMLDLADFGFLLISVGAMFVAVPDLVSQLGDFFSDFVLVEISTNFFLPAPAHPHPEVYYAFFVFFLVFGILHVPLLIGRFMVKDTLRKKASAFTSIILLLGMAYASNLLVIQSIGWFNYIGIFLMLAGFCLIIENLIVLGGSRIR